MRRVDLSDLELTYDPTDPEGFRSAMRRVGPEVGAQRTGMSVYEVPPGQAVCPYHYEYGEEEWMLVIEGRASVRTPEGTEEVGPSEVVFFSTGPRGAHQVRNETEATVRVLVWSNLVYPTATAYPDSDKVGLWTGDEAEDLVAPRSSGVDYFDGESG